MTRSVALRALAFVTIAAATIRCTDGGTAPQVLDNRIGVIVSGVLPPIWGSVPAAQSPSVLPPPSVVFVSLAPASAPGGVAATITNRVRGFSVITQVENGGFDPVAIGATAGDTLLVDITTASSSTAIRAYLAVAARRAPRIVRTHPPSGGRDVPLNSKMVVVFSEPIDPATLTTGVTLVRDTTHVTGSVGFTDSVQLKAAFQPANQLQPGTTYQLVVTPAIQDVYGLVLDSAARVSFTTGSAVLPTVSGITPTDTLAGGPDFTLTINGSGFVPTSSVNFGATNPPTTFVSSTQLTTVIPASAITSPGTVRVSVTNPSAGGGTSDTVNFTVNRVGPFITSVWPGDAVVGGTGFTLTIFASRVDSTSVVSFGGTPRPTALINGLLTASIPASALTAPETAAVAVTNPGPKGGSVDTLHVPVHTLVPVSGFTRISVGYDHSCAVTSAGVAYCWGLGYMGELGIAPLNGTGLIEGFEPVSDRIAPGPVVSYPRLPALSFATMSARSRHTCALTPTGDAYCWGYGPVQGGSGPYVLPFTVGPGPFAAISSGGEDDGGAFECLLATTGTASCLGRNSVGQLGDGTTTDKLYPVTVAGGLSFTALSAGGEQRASIGVTHQLLPHACGLTNSGAVYCWGDNSFGQLGDGTTSQRSSPVLVLGGLTFTAVAAGGAHTCSLTTGGAAYCWGDNSAGQLGDGTTTRHATPVAVLGGLAFASLSAGGDQTCGLTTSGVAYCWGDNSSGQLGDGTQAGRTSPTAVTGSLSFAMVSTGANHSCGITTAGVSYCWGDNTFGQLGNGTSTVYGAGGSGSSVPVKVLGQ